MAIVFTTSVIYLLPPDHPVFSASSSSPFCPFLGDDRPHIRPSTIQGPFINASINLQSLHLRRCSSTICHHPSSTSFLSFAHVFRQRQRSYIHQDIQFGVIHRTNSSYLIIYCDEQTSMPYPWHHPLLHQYLCPLIQYHDLMWICYD